MSQFSTGDILLFEHKFDTTSIKTSFMSILDEGIGWFSKSRYSHVGIVLKDPEFTSPHLKGLFLFESNRKIFLMLKMARLNLVWKSWICRMFWTATMAISTGGN